MNEKKGLDQSFDWDSPVICREDLTLKLSILDQSPMTNEQTARDALIASRKLAQLGETLGYTRFWMTEHHDLDGLASSAPEVLLSYVGAYTKSIRLGTGAVLLPHYKPYKVAEVHHTLATLFPGRIDIGLGRAPGGSAEATNALSDAYLQQVYRFPELVEELLLYINQKHPVLKASPVPDVAPEVWILGTSEKSAILAGEKKLSYAFGQFMSAKDGEKIISTYVNTFNGTKEQRNKRPQALLTVSVYCAETKEKAEEIALPALIWSIRGKGNLPSIEEAKKTTLTEKEKASIQKRKENMIIGDPFHVKQQLLRLKETYQVKEVMIVTNTATVEDRMQSYQFISEQLL